MATSDVKNGVTMNGGTSKYGAGAGATARADLIATDGWAINDGGPI
jgi:hypothetical protein